MKKFYDVVFVLLLLAVLPLSSCIDLHPDAFYERLLEQFCQDHFDELYEDIWGTRSYVPGSLRVNSVQRVDNGEVDVYGTFDFKGRDIALNQDHSGYRFEANVYESDTHIFNVTFKKESRTFITGSVYWEKRTKKGFYYKE